MPSDFKSYVNEAMKMFDVSIDKENNAMIQRRDFFFLNAITQLWTNESSE